MLGAPGSPASAGEHKYRADIDGMRAVAVLLVIAYHAFPNVVRGGYIGVDIFFVISGFLITEIIFKQIAEGRFSLAGFYSRRIRRIFPALIVVIFAAVAAGWFLFPVKEFKSLGLNVAGAAAFAENLVLLSEVGYFDVAAVKKPLLHIWSLGIEEQYYIVWPLLLLWVHRARLNYLTACALLSGASFWVCIHYMQTNVERGFYLPTSRAWELLAGSWLAILAARYRHDDRARRWINRLEALAHAVLYAPGEAHRKDALQNLCAGLAILVVGLAAFRFSSALAYPGYFAVVPVAAAAALIASPGAFFNRRVLSAKPVVFVGLISYPLYLWHFPVFAYAHSLLPEGMTTPVAVLAVLLSFVLAWLTYVCVEKPLRFGAAREFAVIPSLVLMAGLLIAGILIYRGDGVPGRLPKELQKFMLTGEETSRFWRRGECLLLPDQGADAFTNQCAGSQRKPLLLLWGDSYAAAAYPGLKHFADLQGFEVAEFTSSACPPAIGYVHPGRPFCKGNNDFVLKRIKDLRPDLVILHSTWAYAPEVLEAGLSETIRELNAASIKVVLLGPVPSWGGGSGLSANVIDYYYEHGFSLIPERTTYRLTNVGQDAQMRAIARKVGARYVSAWDALCDLNGCLARIGEGGGKLTAFDVGHLTADGSTYVAGKILPELLQGLR